MTDRDVTPIAEVIGTLVNGLGTNLTDGLLDAWGPLGPEWGAGAVVPVEAEARLRSAHHIFTMVSDAEGAATARALMIGMNPHLNDEAMITVIAEGRFRDAKLAADTYLGNV